MPWELTGNAGTNPATNFLGTAEETVPQPLVIKTNGAERMRITADGNVGIGIENPSYAQLHVSGQIATGRNMASAGAITFFPPDGSAWFHIDHGPATDPTGRLRISYGGKPGEHEIMSLDQESNVQINGSLTVGQSLYTNEITRTYYEFTSSGVVPLPLFIRDSTRISSNGDWQCPQLWIEQTAQDGWARIRFSRAGSPISRHWDIAVGGSVGLEVMNFNVQDTGDIMTLSRDGAEIKGTLTVSNDIVLTNADCAEEFDIDSSVEVEPGTVMVLDHDDMLRPSTSAYDKRVAGVISGGGDYKPGIILDKQQVLPNRKPVALVGKVYCKVDAHYASIEVGDLLTTSDTPGHAMKAVDPLKAFGSVIGKALRPLEVGQGIIPILIALQ